VYTGEQAAIPASKDACGLCSKAIYGKQKFIVLDLAPPDTVSCLNISETKYSCYMAIGDSTIKCASCVKSLRSQGCDDLPVKTRSDAPVIPEVVSPVKVISPDRALALSPLFDGDKYEAQIFQLETVHLNGQCAVDLIKTLLDLAHKLNEDVTHLKMTVLP
jgi:hypothetical protein